MYAVGRRCVCAVLGGYVCCGEEGECVLCGGGMCVLW